MKRLVLVLLLAVLSIVLWPAAASACSLACGYANTPWGQTVAVCLSYPTGDGYQVCFEINTKSREGCTCEIHECALFNPCRNGYPLP